MKPTITIDEAAVDDTSRCTLRFVSPDAKPVLYLDGRRVIRPWSVKVAHDEPKDENGCSA